MHRFLVITIFLLQGSVVFASISAPEAKGYVDTIQKGIEELNQEKVRDGLMGLYKADLDESSLPLELLFDLVETMRYGREGFFP